MNKMFNKIMGFGATGSAQKRELPVRIKGRGKQFDELSALAKEKGLELYADTVCNCYWVWKDGNTIEGTTDPFNTLRDVSAFLKTYSTNKP